MADYLQVFKLTKGLFMTKRNSDFFEVWKLVVAIFGVWLFRSSKAFLWTSSPLIMAKFGLVWLVCCLYIWTCASAKGTIRTLTTENFEEIVTDDPGLWLVKFYAPWCGHCKKLAPDFVETAARSKRLPIRFGEVDCPAETELCQGFEVNRYPTLLLFRDGSQRKYTFGRTLEDMVEFVELVTAPPVSHVSDIELEAKLSTTEVTSFLLLASPSDQQVNDLEHFSEYQIFTQVARNNQERFRFYFSAHPSVFQKYHSSIDDSLPSPRVIALYAGSELPYFPAASPADDQTEEADLASHDSWNTDEHLQTFVEDNKEVLLVTLSGRTNEHVVRNPEGRRAVLGVVTLPSLPDTEHLDDSKTGGAGETQDEQIEPKTHEETKSEDVELLRGVLIELAKLHDDYVFAVVDSGAYTKYLATFGIVSTGSPLIFAVDTLQDEYYLAQDSLIPTEESDNHDKEVFKYHEETDINYLNLQEMNEFIAHLGSEKSPRTPARNFIKWYNPTRYLRQLQRVLAEYFTSTQIMIGAYGILGAFMLLSFYIILKDIPPMGVDLQYDENGNLIPFSPEQRESLRQAQQTLKKARDHSKQN